jgi:hypothetical protein
MFFGLEWGKTIAVSAMVVETWRGLLQRHRAQSSMALMLSAVRSKDVVRQCASRSSGEGTPGMHTTINKPGFKVGGAKLELY